MERLTRRINGVVVYVGAKNPNSTGQIPCEVEPAGVREMMDRLAAYEDKELEPEEVLPKDKADEIALKLMRLADLESICSYTRLRELAEADKAGRLVVLPCRIGATAYILIQDSAIFYPETNGWYIVEETIDAITQDGFYLGATEDGDFRPNDAIGKTVFLTREEAEKALEAMKK